MQPRLACVTVQKKHALSSASTAPNTAQPSLSSSLPRSTQNVQLSSCLSSCPIHEQCTTLASPHPLHVASARPMVTPMAPPRGAHMTHVSHPSCPQIWSSAIIAISIRAKPRGTLAMHARMTVGLPAVPSALNLWISTYRGERVGVA